MTFQKYIFDFLTRKIASQCIIIQTKINANKKLY